jgi:hypothetical protein
MATKKSDQGKNKLSLEGTIPKLTLTMPVDAAKAKAIQRCIAKGTLSITVSKVDLQTGRIGDAWLYD